MASPRLPIQVGVALGVALAAVSIVLFSLFGSDAGSVAVTTTTDPSGSVPPGTTLPTVTVPGNGEATTTTAVGQVEPTDPYHRWVDRRTVGQPWGNEVEGLLTFRGNPTNTFYGKGPVPGAPEVKWRYPDNPMCGQSTDLGVTSTWCGNGWTGQPIVWERPDGITELMFGAYDHRFHFVDAATGTRTRSPIQTGDIVKGSPTLDPDGFPLVYFGSRDNKLRIVALDRDDPVVLWDFETPKPLCNLGTLDGHGSTCFGLWNDDWDAAPRVVNDILFASGENSIFYIWKLNRTYDSLGLVTIEPELLVEIESWNDQLLADIQSGCTVGVRCISTSIESTPAFYEGRVYFGTSAGRVMGLDITNVENGEAPIVFDYWVGDDVDASIVIDDRGMLYVPVEWKRFLPRGRELGQLIKLDPYTSGDPYVWGMYSLTEPPSMGGLFATPALGDGVLYVVTHRGFLVVVDMDTGEELWAHQLAPGSWSSPAVVDDRLVVVDHAGDMRAFDLTDPRAPRLLWTFRVGGATVEATPAVWKGTIYLASRDGFMYAIGSR
jgi:outer membrane protein assembly factor BamB